MATTKKTHTTKKASTSKRKTISKKPPRLTWRFYVVTIGIFAVAVSTVVVIALLTASTLANRNNQARLDEIKGVYKTLNIGDEYRLVGSNVFGDKRVYEWDKGRTYSSSVEYIHGDTVSNTVAELDAKIKAAGFTFIDEPYPGSVAVQYHYKSAEGQYIRLTVSSKPYDDAWANAIAMGKETPDGLDEMDKNLGPSNVTIKVNLDDNNE